MNAKDYFLTGLNCSQAVFAPFAIKHIPDLKTALKIMSPFGGGVSHTDNICGAVSGGIAAIGINVGHSEATDMDGKQFCKEVTQKFLSEFKKLHGSINCTDLINYNLSVEEERIQANEEIVFRKICPNLVESAEKIVQGLLNEIENQKK